MADLNYRTDIKLATKTLEAIDVALTNSAEDGFREHMGASIIGRKCNREIWYSFRWATYVQHDPRILRLFQRGQDEEDRITKLLRLAGIKVLTVDSTTGQQFRFKDGHFGGSMDGACIGVPDAPKTWHALEDKTHGLKSFNKLEAEGVKKSKPEHYAQVQVYMQKMQLTRALYVAVCKDDDRLHLERIDFDPEFAQSMIDKAHWIINLPTPPDGISTDPSWYECKFCDHQATCHGSRAPVPTCRSCTHSTPETDGTWTCGRMQDATLSAIEQKEACSEHRYIPILLKNWAEPVDASEEKNWVSYKLKTSGFEFKNADPQDGFTSQELYALKEKSMLECKDLMDLRKQFDGRVVG